MSNENTKINVLLIHGWGGNSHSDWKLNGWTEFLDSLNLNPIYVDILGHGNSNTPVEPNEYNDLASNVLNEIKEISTPYAIGFSLGCKILLEIASREPNRFIKVVIAGLGNNCFSHEKLGEELAQSLENNDFNHEIPMVNKLAKYGIANGNNPLSLAACLRRKPNPVITEDKIRNLNTNFQIICGDKDEVAFPFDRLAQILPNHSESVIKDVNHLDLPSHPELKKIVAVFFHKN